ncbi:MAG TPA: ATP-binding protein [Propionicimonas sp.]|jgi:two-component system OmpR family sensor kinase
MKRHSLTWRLSILVALTTILMAGGAGAWSYTRALQEARDLQDDVLAQVASIASATTTKGTVAVDEIPLSDNASDIDVTSLKRAGLPTTTPNGIGTAQIGGESRRIFVIRSSGGPELVVSQSIEVRDQTARASAAATVTPLLLLLPALLLAIYLVVRNVLRPVNRLAEHVNARAATDLSPLNVEQAPEELRGFLAALNAQFDRVHAALIRERLFIAEAAHELRTPLTAMSLQLERAAIAPDSARLRERLGELRRGVERSRHLISQLLDLAQAQAGSTETLPPQPLETIVRHVVSELLPLADGATIEIDVDLTDAGAQQLPVAATTSVLRNLLDNAIRYSKPGGQVHLAARNDGQDLVISVDDNGPGINSPDEVLRPFTREAGQDTQGSGLGLSIVSEQVARLNGRLELLATTRFDGGTEARITLHRSPHQGGNTTVAHSGRQTQPTAPARDAERVNTPI